MATRQLRIRQIVARKTQFYLAAHPNEKPSDFQREFINTYAQQTDEEIAAEFNARRLKWLQAQNP